MSTLHGTVSVLTTGGTIACTTARDGSLSPTVAAADLVAAVTDAGTDLRTGVGARDLTLLDSSKITLADVDDLIAAVRAELADPQVVGVVVTHGTDSLEDSAIAVDLVHDDPRPVVFTGAQRAFDHPETDGPANLGAALRLAADPAARDRGVLVAFGGRVLPARGVSKRHTAELVAFDSPGGLDRPAPLPPTPLAGTEVMVLAAWPGAGRGLVDSAVSLGARGLVVEALGSGNVGAGMGEALVDALASGIPVVVTTRVPEGEVRLAYAGAGGGATLADHGAVPAGALRAGQSRMVLARAIVAGVDPRTLF